MYMFYFNTYFYLHTFVENIAQTMSNKEVLDGFYYLVGITLLVAFSSSCSVHITLFIRIFCGQNRRVQISFSVVSERYNWLCNLLFINAWDVPDPRYVHLKVTTVNKIVRHFMLFALIIDVFHKS